MSLTASAKQQRYRERQREGKRVLRSSITDEAICALAEFLIDAGLLDPGESLDDPEFMDRVGDGLAWLVEMVI